MGGRCGLQRRGSAAQRAVVRRGRLRRLLQQSGDGYQAMRWSNLKSGPGWPRRFQSGEGSGAASSQAGGPRAGSIRSGRCGSPICLRMRLMGAVSLMKAMMRMSAPQLGQASGEPVWIKAVRNGRLHVGRCERNCDSRCDQGRAPAPRSNASTLAATITER